jgi:hypothetical protein
MFTGIPETIRPHVKKVLEAAMEHECCEYAEIWEVPPYVLKQVPQGEYVYIHYKIKGPRSESGELVDLCLLVPYEIIDEDSYKQLPFDGLYACPCPIMDSADFGKSLVDGHEPFRNRGRLIYVVRPPTMELVLLDHEPPQLVILKSAGLKSLEQKLLALDKVNSVQFEYVTEPKIIDSMNCERPLIVIANIDIIDKDNPNVKTYNACFSIPETVYEYEIGHQWAIDNLQEVIDKSNVTD